MVRLTHWMTTQGYMKEGLFLSVLLILVLSAQTIIITSIPSSDYVIVSEGEELPLYCFLQNEDQSQTQTAWLIKRTGDNNFIPTAYNGSTGDISSPESFIGKFTATGELIPNISLILTFQTNFTILNFTDEFNLAQIICGTGNPGENKFFTIGLPGKVSYEIKYITSLQLFLL